jgi:hypothetical protein
MSAMLMKLTGTTCQLLEVNVDPINAAENDPEFV